MLLYNGGNFVCSKNTSPLLYIYLFEKMYLELCEVFSNATLA
jgi:hypothetical protein